MYSVVLMMAMTTSTPGELFPNRPHLFGVRSTGCTGTALAAPPRETFLARAPVRGLLAHVAARLHERPRGVFLASGPRSSYGCAGTTFAVPVARATGCSGGAVLVAPAGCTGGVALVQAGAVAGQPMEAGGRLIERVAVHRQLRVALRSGNLTPEQAAIAKQALDDPNIYEAAVSKVTHDLNKKQLATGTVGAFDGHILALLLKNLPAIIDAIKQILAIFGPHAFALPPVHDWQPMPVGPWGPARVVVADLRLAC